MFNTGYIIQCCNRVINPTVPLIMLGVVEPVWVNSVTICRGPVHFAVQILQIYHVYHSFHPNVNQNTKLYACSNHWLFGGWGLVGGGDSSRTWATHSLIFMSNVHFSTNSRFIYYSDVLWAPCYLKSPAIPPFVQPFVQATPKKTSKLCVTGNCERNPPHTGGFSKRACNAENISIWWRHHDLIF